ncbi:ribosomal-processing cysteine protease Prp [Spiroplasma endosymbiont of Nebria brevicollis]|uniref:ribosomal-processing cysteine protease Prp n=1 Tax=Spiroplasma endosymbiont of Nebria brevicollis TaxID=3066284 RepID=UPI00313C4CD5
MVKVTCNYQNNNIDEVTITGHANFLQLGTDIVCAAVSAIVIGTLNALDQMEKKTIKVINNKSGFVKIKVIISTNDNQVMLKTMLWQLKTISAQYTQYLKIKEV